MKTNMMKKAIAALAHADFRVGDHAEFKYMWVPIHGWCTKGCTITEVACTVRDGRWAPVYKNSYNNNFYLRCDYE